MKLQDHSASETPIVPARIQPWIGPSVALGLAILLLLLNRNHRELIPNPNLIFALVLVFSSYMGGLASGFTATLIAIAFVAYDWAIPGHPLTYSLDNSRRLIVTVICLPSTALLAGLLKARADLQHRAIANYLALEKKRNRELALALTVLACGTCIKSRHQGASEVCPISTMVDCLDMVLWADKVITF